MPRWPQRTTEERFWDAIEVVDGCWLWQHRLTNTGYGYFGVSAERGMVRAHRFAYELLVGPIPEGLELDHLCRNRACVNPAHLEPVTHAENLRRSARVGAGRHVGPGRRERCKRGHPLTDENRYTSPKGSTRCRLCHNERMRAYLRARRAIHKR